MMRGDELIHALAKVKSFIPANQAKDIEFKVNQICIDLSPWMENHRGDISPTGLSKTNFKFCGNVGNNADKNHNPHP